MTSIGGISKVEQEIRETEGRRISALVKLDIAELDRILAEDLTYVHAGGRVDTKAGLIAFWQSGGRWESIDREDIQVRVTNDAGVITGKAHYKGTRQSGEPRNLDVQFTAVYLQRDGRWQLAAYQSTRLPES